ncbi:S9 family peptidase [soil metagenome]
MSTQPYGTWPSPVSADLLASGAIGLSEPSADGEVVRWLELRPAEAGRTVLVERAPDGSVRDAFGADWHARTLVHEYGGGAYLARDGVVWFSNFADQRVYRIAADEDPAAVTAVTPEPARPRADRYADADLHPDGRLLYAVREHHPASGEVVNEIVVLAAEGGEPRLVAGGHDFYAAPRVSPDGAQLAWLTWDHPRMPWDGTELHVGRITDDGVVTDVRTVAGGPEESLAQPEWAPDGRLTVCSDRTGWWNLCAVGEQALEPLAPMEAEVGQPAWVFGSRSYAWLDDGRVAMAANADGRTRLLVRETDGTVRDAGFDGSPHRVVAAGHGRVIVAATSPTQPLVLARVDLATGAAEVLRRSTDLDLDPAHVSVPEALTFPTSGQQTAHANYYPPTNADVVGPDGERPPLLVLSHGGPTAQSPAAFSLGIQFWTTRGFAVVDVNYGGSTGYGRAYRQRLDGQWGRVDVEDCVAAAGFLVDRGDVDADRLAIRGGSAGGWTTLCALTFTDTFAAGASHFGVADAARLAVDTHKFESRYLDRLIGPWPQAEEVYRQRSPIHHTQSLSCPLILLQGLEDEVVPPSQAEMMVEALRARGIPYAYVTFAGEQHGFRQAASIVRAAEAELSFYGQVFGFDPADDLEPVTLHRA